MSGLEIFAGLTYAINIASGISLFFLPENNALKVALLLTFLITAIISFIVASIFATQGNVAGSIVGFVLFVSTVLIANYNKKINTMVRTMFERETTTFEPKQPPFEVVISPGLRKELRKRPPPPPSRPHAVIEQQPQPQRLPPLPPPPPPSRIEKRRF